MACSSPSSPPDSPGQRQRVVVAIVGALPPAVPSLALPGALVADPERLLPVVEVVAVVVAAACVSLPELSTIQPGTRAAQSNGESR